MIRRMAVRNRDQTGEIWIDLTPSGFAKRSPLGGSNTTVAAWRGGTRVAANKVASEDSKTAICL